jgi:hypothetical protein
MGLRTVAEDGTDREYALETPEHRDNARERRRRR